MPTPAQARPQPPPAPPADARAATRCAAASTHRHRRRRARAWLLAAGLCAAAPAAATQFAGAASLGSQLVDRGVATSARRPILQAAAYWTPNDDWAVSLSGAADAGSPGTLLQSGIAATRWWRRSERWRWHAGLSHSRYLVDGVRDWRIERSELQLGWQYQDRAALTLSAARLRGHARAQAALDLTWRRPLTPQWSLVAGLGAAEIPRYRDGIQRSGVYGYGHAGLAWRRERWSAELYRLAADAGAPRPWDVPRAAPWALTLTLAL